MSHCVTTGLILSLSPSVMESNAAYEAITRLADDVRLKGTPVLFCAFCHTNTELGWQDEMLLTISSNSIICVSHLLLKDTVDHSPAKNSTCDRIHICSNEVIYHRMKTEFIPQSILLLLLMLQSLKYFTAVLWDHQSKRIVIKITYMCLGAPALHNQWWLSEATHTTLMETAVRRVVCGSVSKDRYQLSRARLSDVDVHLSEHVHGKLSCFCPLKKEKKKVLISPSSKFPLSTFTSD